MRLQLFLVTLILLVMTLPLAATAPMVLFDNCHDESISNANWTINGGFSDFAETFANLGFTVEEIKQGPVLYDQLKKAAVFVVGEPNTRFTDDEERAIVNWVKNGGCLYLVADHTNSDRNNDGYDSPKIFNRFSKEFGFDFLECWIGRMEPITVDNRFDEVLTGVDQVGIWGGTLVNITDQNKAQGYIPITYTDNKTGETFKGFYMAAAKFEKGRVVALGDSSPYDDGTADNLTAFVHDGYNLVDYGHRQLARNTIQWLMNKEITTAFLPISINLHQEKLNTNPGETLEIPWKLNVGQGHSGTATVNYYIRKIKETNLLHTATFDVTPGENLITQSFSFNDEGLLRVYVTATLPGVKETARAFTSVKVGRIPRICVDKSHENDWTNRMRAVRTFLDSEGIFYSDARKALGKAISKPDINMLLITAPQKGNSFSDDRDIMAVVDFLKRDGVLILTATSDSGTWGDNAGFAPLLKALNLPLTFNDDSLFINDPSKNSTLQPVLEGYPAPWGEMPCSLIKREGGKGQITELAIAPAGTISKDVDGDGATAVDPNHILVDAMIDLTHSDIGAGRVLLLGSCHFTNWCFKDEAANNTPTYLRKILRNALPGEIVTPLSQILPTTTANSQMIVMGVVKSFANSVLTLTDSGKELECVGTFPQGFSPRQGAIIKIRGTLVKEANWFKLQCN